MIPISARVSTEGVFKRLTDFPATLDKHLLPALDRWMIETTREAQNAAAKMDRFGTNKIAIHGEKPDTYTRVVATGTRYAIYVEEGIKPNQPRMPNISGLYTWVAANAPGADVKQLDRLTYVIARSIQKKGIKAQPYMAPTAEKMIPRGGELVANAVLAAAEEIGGAA